MSSTAKLIGTRSTEGVDEGAHLVKSHDQRRLQVVGRCGVGPHLDLHGAHKVHQIAPVRHRLLQAFDHRDARASEVTAIRCNAREGVTDGVGEIPQLPVRQVTQHIPAQSLVSASILVEAANGNAVRSSPHALVIGGVERGQLSLLPEGLRSHSSRMVRYSFLGDPAMRLARRHHLHFPRARRRAVAAPRGPMSGMMRSTIVRRPGLRVRGRGGVRAVTWGVATSCAPVSGSCLDPYLCSCLSRASCCHERRRHPTARGPNRHLGRLRLRRGSPGSARGNPRRDDLLTSPSCSRSSRCEE